MRPAAVVVVILPYYKLTSNELNLILALKQFNYKKQIRGYQKSDKLNLEHYHNLDKVICYFMKNAGPVDRHILLINLIIGIFILFQNINLKDFYSKYCDYFFGERIFYDPVEFSEVQNHLNEISNDITLLKASSSSNYLNNLSYSLYIDSIFNFITDIKLMNKNLISKPPKDRIPKI